MLFIMLVGHPPFDGEGVKESIFTRVVIGDYKVLGRGMFFGLFEYMFIFLDSLHYCFSFLFLIVFMKMI